jgi:hypothetical protein
MGGFDLPGTRTYRVPTYYTVRTATAVHTKGEHARVKVNGGYRVQPGLRASVWGFTAPRPLLQDGLSDWNYMAFLR